MCFKTEKKLYIELFVGREKIASVPQLVVKKWNSV